MIAAENAVDLINREKMDRNQAIAQRQMKARSQEIEEARHQEIEIVRRRLGEQVENGTKKYHWGYQSCYYFDHCLQPPKIFNWSIYLRLFIPNPHLNTQVLLNKLVIFALL